MTREKRLDWLCRLRSSLVWFDIPSKDRLMLEEALSDEIKALEQEPCEDCISRQAVEKITWEEPSYTDALNVLTEVRDKIRALPPVTPQQKMGHCKDCKYFEYDSVAKVDGIPLIVAHEICKKWGDGCKTNENGYCFLFEPQESEG